MLDLATGGGAVLRAISDERPDLELTGVDYAVVPNWSPVHRIMSGVDCANLPFPDASFEAVTSQFGIEYCPADTIREALRVLRPGGRARFVIHHAGSPAIRHNHRRRDAMRALFDAGLFAIARQLAARLPGDTGPQAQAVQRVRAAFPDQRIAVELPLALRQALHQPDALARIADMECRAGAELDRLSAMVAASFDERAMARFADTAEKQGATVETGALTDGDGICIAWRMDARANR